MARDATRMTWSIGREQADVRHTNQGKGRDAIARNDKTRIRAPELTYETSVM